MTDNASSNNNKIHNNITANGIKTSEINIKEIQIKMNNGWQYLLIVILFWILSSDEVLSTINF